MDGGQKAKKSEYRLCDAHLNWDPTNPESPHFDMDPTIPRPQHSPGKNPLQEHFIPPINFTISKWRMRYKQSPDSSPSQWNLQTTRVWVLWWTHWRILVWNFLAIRDRCTHLRIQRATIVGLCNSHPPGRCNSTFRPLCSWECQLICRFQAGHKRKVE